MDIVQDRLFESEIVEIDGRVFARCRLINCELRYCGGTFHMVDTLVSGCQWAFGGAARRTLEVLSNFEIQHGGSPSPEVLGGPELSRPLIN